MPNLNSEASSRAIVFEALTEAKGEIVSSARLTKLLSSTRQAVFKAVCALKEEGVPIESIPQKGYRITDVEEIDALSPTMIEHFLRENPIFNKCIYLKETDSTHKVIKKAALRDEAAGLVAVTDLQTGGRGRRGRLWESPSGKNLMFSMLLRPELKPGEVQLLNLAAGIAVKETLRELCNVPAELKWPNDILCSGKKICGILSEASGEPDRIYYAVTGVGLNVNMGREEIPAELSDTTTSLFIEGGKVFPRWRLLVDFLNRFADMMMLLSRKDGTAELLSLYRSKCDTIGQRVRVVSDDEEITGVACNITDEGAIVVRGNMRDRVFAAAEVFHLRTA